MFKTVFVLPLGKSGRIFGVKIKPKKERCISYMIYQYVKHNKNNS